VLSLKRHTAPAHSEVGIQIIAHEVVRG